jgi:hypothetical protein
MDSDDYWDCGTPKSKNNAFSFAASTYKVDWKRLSLNANNSAVSTRTVERRRASGEANVGSIPLTGRKQAAKKVHISIEPKQQVQGSADKRQKLKRGASI